MSDVVRTVNDAVEEFRGRYFPKDLPKHQTYNPRLWFHDAIHAICKAPTTDTASEVKAAIYHAVLLKQGDVFPAHVRTIESDDNVPELWKVRAFVVPGAIDFLRRNGGYPASSDHRSIEFIAEHYGTARKLGEMIYERFGINLGEFSPSELGAMPLKDFHDLLEIAQESNLSRSCSSVWR